MIKKLLPILIFFLLLGYSKAQTKVSGRIFDEVNEPLAYATVLFKGSIEGTTSDENGRFYLESSKNWAQLVVSFMGYETLEIELSKKVNFNLKFVLKEEANTLNEVVIAVGKQPKKNNPAIAILEKIWEKRRRNGLKKFNQYSYKKYEKVEFDLNNIDSTFKNKGLFRGMEFVFKNLDTSAVTGKTYLPVFLNESVSEVYGDNILNREKEIIKGNKNTGFSNNQAIINFIDDLYNDYDIYDNYIKLFYKSFVSPLSKTGVSNYNYFLSDSAFIKNKWCYNIIYYPRRKNELTFKGDFWVNDTTFAIKKITMAVTKSANINWVKDIYIEQEFEVMNDSVFLLTKDYMMSDFSFSKKEESKGVYGKRTTLAKNHKFDIQKEDKFYKEEVNFYMEWATTCKHYKAIANWMIGPIRAAVNEGSLSFEQLSKLIPYLVELVELVETNQLSFSVASTRVFKEMMANPGSPKDYATINNLLQTGSTDEIEKWIEEVLANHPEKVAEYRKGKKGLLGLFVGEVKKISKGKADPKMTTILLEQKLT